MNNRQQKFFEVSATEVLQSAYVDSHRIIEYVDGEPVPAPLASPLQREEYERFVSLGLPVTFTIRVQLLELLNLADSFSDHIAEVVFSNAVRPQMCDYRVVGASYGRFSEPYSGYVHLQVCCLLDAF
jgi:hypothetical protein